MPDQDSLYLFPTSHADRLAHLWSTIVLLQMLSMNMHASHYYRVTQNYGSLGRGTGNLRYRPINQGIDNSIDAIVHETDASERNEI